MKNHFLITTIFIILFVGCDIDKRKPERRTFKNYTVEATYLDSNLIDGRAKYFDKGGNLIYIENYVQGKKEGYATSYYPNQKLKDSMFFSNGLKNGFSYRFDPAGKLIRKSFNYYGLTVGDQFYRASDRKNVYFFLDFDKNVLIRCEYDSVGKSQLLHFDVNPKVSTVFNGNDSAYNLLIYFPNPPELSMKFMMGIKNETNKTKNEKELFNERLFLDTVVMKPKKGWYPYVSVHVENLEDSINQIHYYEFKME